MTNVLNLKNHVPDIFFIIGYITISNSIVSLFGKPYYYIIYTKILIALINYHMIFIIC